MKMKLSINDVDNVTVAEDLHGCRHGPVDSHRDDRRRQRSGRKRALRDRVWGRASLRPRLRHRHRDRRHVPRSRDRPHARGHHPRGGCRDDSERESVTATLSVSVTDVNDVTPTCAPSIIVQSLAEGMAAGSSLVTLSYSDADLDPNNINNKIGYAISAGNAAGYFAVDALSGELSLSGSAVLNYETTKSYTLTVTATDAGTRHCQLKWTRLSPLQVRLTR